jgi:SAM-dependent methyltransferase
MLEVGCGSGRNLWMLAKEGFAVHGVYASLTALAVARTHLQEKWGVRAQLAAAPFDSLPFADGYFDMICDVVSLQHTSIAGSRKALAEINRCLKPNGHFFSYRLSDASIMYRQSGGAFIDSVTVDNIVNSSMPLANNGQTSFWSPALAEEVFQECGFNLKALERHGRTAQGNGHYVEYLALVGMKRA